MQFKPGDKVRRIAASYYGELKIGDVCEVSRSYVHPWREDGVTTHQPHIDLVGHPGASFLACNFELVDKAPKTEGER